MTDKRVLQLLTMMFESGIHIWGRDERMMEIINELWDEEVWEEQENAESRSVKIKMLECPFCGSINITRRSDNGKYVLCNECHAEVHDHQGTDKDVEIWNRRVRC